MNIVWSPLAVDRISVLTIRHGKQILPIEEITP